MTVKRITHGKPPAYIRLNDNEVHESEEVHPRVIFDFDKDGKLCAVEVLPAPEEVKPKEATKT